MKKKLIWVFLCSCFLFFFTIFNAECGLLDNLKSTISPKEKGTKPSEEGKKIYNPTQEDTLKKKQEEKTIGDESAELEIKPFGNFDWVDTLGDVIEKINNIEGIEKVEFIIPPKTAINLRGVKKNEIGKILEEIETRNLPKKGNKNYETQMKVFLQSANKYIDIDGNQRLYKPTKIPPIKASPIMIKGIPFVIEIKFSYAPGIAIDKPNELLKGEILTFPVALEEIILISTSPTLPDIYSEINGIFDEKYGRFADRKKSLNSPYAVEIYWPQGTCRINDGKGGTLFVHVEPSKKPSKYTIRYSSEKYTKNLDEIYRKHLSEIEAKKTGGKKDMSKDL